MNWQVTGVLVLLLGLSCWMLKGAIEDRVKYEIAAKQAELALEFERKTGEINQELVDLRVSTENELNTLRVSKDQEIRGLRNTLESNYAKNPFGAANDSELRLALSLCLYESGNDRDLRKSCNDRAASSDAPRFASLVASTADTAEDWRILCEGGQRDFCDYTLISFTKEGWLSHLEWVAAVDRDQMSLRDQLDSEKKWREKQQEVVKELNQR